MLARETEDGVYQSTRKIITLVIDDPDYPTIETIADNIVSQCKARTANEYELALALHDWLIDHTTYDDSLMYCHPEGALARGLSICDSYQLAYAMLLNRAGIENDRVEALVSGGGHTWNLVKLDGNWYHIDPTWDDGTDRHLYFGVTDELIALSQGHQPFTPVSEKACTSLADNYYVRSGEAGKWADGYEQLIHEHLAAGETSFTFDSGMLEDNTYNDDIRKAICACYLSQKNGWEVTYSV